MVYSVKDFLASNTGIVPDIVRAVDKQLKESGYVTVDLTKYSKYVEQQTLLANQLKAMYEGAGWRVEVHQGHDYRESWYSLAIKLPPNTFK